MGSMASCARQKAASPHAATVVHFNNQVDKFPAPVAVERVLQDHPLHFICNSRDLFPVSRPLQPKEELCLGELYFLLPLSAIESADNLQALGTTLNATARKEASKAAQRRRSAGSTCDLPGEGCSSNRSSMYERLVQRNDEPEGKMGFEEYLILKRKARSPRLPTIHETSRFPG